MTTGITPQPNTGARSGALPSVFFDVAVTSASSHHDENKIVVLTDENVFKAHEGRFQNFPVITILPGESNKNQGAVDKVISQLLELNVDKSWLLLGVGGGVVTDIAGFVASIFKRGIHLGLAPSTILGMTDAALGGKNGVNAGTFKNMVGTTYRAKFILYDYSLLDTLPRAEFVNGFAEIIKHACIRDKEMFSTLVAHDISFWLKDRAGLAQLIERNVGIKTSITAADEFESGERYLLNFGHSFGHAIEAAYGIPHGHAISIGMLIAAKISEVYAGFQSSDTSQIEKLLLQYELPVSMELDSDRILAMMSQDKKRIGEDMMFVLLSELGHGIVKSLSLQTLRECLPN